MNSTDHRAFADKFAAAFRDRFARLDDRAAAWAARAILVGQRAVANDMIAATPDLSGRTTVNLDEAMALLRAYNAVESYRAFGRLPVPLVAEDDTRRYSIEKNVTIKTPDNATVCAVVARPRSAHARLPALMQFTIYADSVATLREALLTAAHGYAGVTAMIRGKACSRDSIVAYAHDGADAAAVIDWIAAQPWSDGRVGMFGGSYSGFTVWATAKRMPRALKAIMAGSPQAPGVDSPMESGVFWNFLYPWPFYTTNNRWLDNATYNDFARWSRLNRTWYSTGRAYRDLQTIDGTPNPLFMEWLSHPTLDTYWRGMMPNEAEYARLNIPVLQTAGYFFGGPGGALWHFREHYKYNPRAQHYLLIGPYDHPQAQRGVVSSLSDTTKFIAGYETDPVAHIDMVTRLRYQWFDYAIRGAPKPALLRDRVNYQLMGANVWKHAPSLSAASRQRMRLYLNAALSGGRHTLTKARGSANSSITHIMNLADRSDVDAPLVGGVMDKAIDTTKAVVLWSEPLPRTTEMTGLLSGHLELITNKRDFDFTITLYELLADGRYFMLLQSTSRASLAGHLSERRLLTPGIVQRLDFDSGIRMMSRRVHAGSRLVVTLAIVKNAGQQINYGSGKDVSDESIADASTPLSIRWLPGSYLEIPQPRYAFMTRASSRAIKVSDRPNL